jgi:glycosyltransferase involved in cell wall biosynthesis
MTGMEKGITIITAVFNGVPHLEDTIRSVGELGTAVDEYIIVDGGSSDGTRELIGRYGIIVDRWISEPDRGVYDAMNKGWALAREGNFILFLGCGDKVLSLPDVRLADAHTVIYGRVHKGDSFVFPASANFRLKIGNTLHHQALLVNKQLHPTPPFSLAYRVYSDFDFNQRLLKMGARFVYDPNFVAYAMPGGLSSIFNYRESLKIVRRNFGWPYVVIASAYYLGQYIKWNYFKRGSAA